MYVLEWRIVSALTRGLFWCLFPELRSNEGNKYQNNPLVSAETVRHESTYIILFLTRHNESTNDYKNDEFYTSSRVALARFSFCWWRHNRLLMTSQWPGNCDAITWIVISNSLDIDFIHGDIHGRSCKKFSLNSSVQERIYNDGCHDVGIVQDAAVASDCFVAVLYHWMTLLVDKTLCSWSSKWRVI